MSEKIGALVIDLQGYQLTAEEKELLAHPIVGGIIFFTRNYESPAQLKSLCAAIRAARKLPLLIMADQEGGRVQRFRKDFFALPSLSFFGDWYDKNPALALELSKSAGWLMAAEIMSAGIDLSLAPVVDLNKGVSSVIGTRAFHRNPDIVLALAQHYIQGMREAGMAATLKHFPGHGSVSADSHLDIPVDDRSLQVILEDDIQPFQKLIQNNIPAVMAAHIIFPAIDSAQVSFSRVWLQDILRKQLNFNGVIISDDLNMQGANISTNYADRMQAAREAGCDIALICNNRNGVIQAIDQLPHVQHQLPPEKWRVMQGEFDRMQQNIAQMNSVKNFLQTHMDESQKATLTNP